MDLSGFVFVLNTRLDPIGLLPVGILVAMAANMSFHRMELYSSRIASFQYSLSGLAIASSYGDDDDDDASFGARRIPEFGHFRLLDRAAQQPCSRVRELPLSVHRRLSIQ